jgi:S1-C subfamily serine protease
MLLDKRYKFLLDRAARALGEQSVADAVRKVRAIVGSQNIPDSEPLAQAALNKLHSGQIPAAEELAALEIVVRLLRPVVFSHDGVLDDLPDSADHNLQPQDLKDLWSAFRDRIGSLIGSIGRIETTSGTHVGTGFLVADGVLATNRHVLGVLTFGCEVLTAGSAQVVYKYEEGKLNAPSDIAKIEGVAAIHPNLDMVLLNVVKQGRPPLTISPTTVATGERVVAIGYPGEDRKNNPLFLSSVFNGKFGVKRAALGEVLDGIEVPAFFHDCSTTQGNSGSPIFSLDTARVSGIHRAGFFMYRNEAVDANSLRIFVDSGKS